MAAVLTGFEFASTGIENACALGQGSEDLLEPSLAVYFVDVFDEHGDSLLALCFCESEQAELIARQGQISQCYGIDGCFSRADGWRDDDEFLQRHASRLGTVHDAARVKHPVGVKFHPFLTDRRREVKGATRLQQLRHIGNAALITLRVDLVAIAAQAKVFDGMQA